ncbi:MAG: extracellular solute-binding protein [Deltaproteobacteria bacterium]|nr:extracellular solute-binding protein [Deltaproteobacteria bacterium]
MRKKIVLLAMVFFIAGLAGSVSPAQSAEEVTVYSGNMQGLNDLAAAEFQKATGIKANIVRVPSGVAMKKMRAEKDNPQGDIIWGISKVALMANVDLLAPHKSKFFDLVDAEFRDPEHRWIGTNLQVPVLMYNKTLVKDAEAPRKWSDLLDPKWKNKVAYTNPANSSFSFTVFTMMLHGFGNNEAAWKKMEAFLANMQIVEQSAMVPSTVEKGEFPVGVALEYMGARYLAAGAKIGMIYPEDGTAAQAEGAGIIKGGKNRKPAERFVDFCNEKSFREMVIKEMFRRPARKDLDFSKIVPMPPLSQIKSMPGFVDTDYLNDREKILARIKDILLRIK